LDLAVRKDDSRVHQRHAAVILAIVRQPALTSLCTDTTTTAGIKARRLRAGWDERYLLHALHGKLDAIALHRVPISP
jgi:hypothetical protein